MTDLPPAAALPANLLAATTQATAAPSAAEIAKRTQIKHTSQKFESAFLSVMLQQMFEGTETAAPFGGGQGEQMFKSFLTDAMANKMVANGGIGLASSVQREMLKMQGLH
ncbi:MAG TPA: rod-binding protein [Phenylobacterium sp.]|jgi:Rod binding domain-containing protein|nr:rod-binding protein [Phenylobacterium sp.]